jgi:hypothetical protein
MRQDQLVTKGSRNAKNRTRKEKCVLSAAHFRSRRRQDSTDLTPYIADFQLSLSNIVATMLLSVSSWQRADLCDLEASLESRTAIGRTSAHSEEH